MHRLAITPGEPAGIGPEILVRYVQQPLENQELVAVCDASFLAQTARTLGVKLKLHPFSNTPKASGAGALSVIDVPLCTPAHFGALNPGNAQYVLNTLATASQHCLAGTLNALITGPVHKGVINDAGVAFSGHTEFLAQFCDTARVVMMLATEGLRVALATTHLPLKDVSAAINQADLTETLRILHGDLITKFGLPNPRILVCGLNPHAGEGGHLGQEEIQTIEPVLNHLRMAGMDLIGPLPADTLFTPHHLKNADAVLAMYHDQGLPVLKYKGFGKAVNITLGLPFIRTSVDHGTALDIAGKGIADTGSLHTAIQTALQMVHATSRASNE